MNVYPGKYSLLFSLLFFSTFSNAQLRVSFRINQQPALHASETIFISGNFASWRPGDKDYAFKYGGAGIATIDLALSPGMYEYKFTRGSWDKVEVTEDGSDVQNRIMQISRDTTIYINIAGWSDDFPAKKAEKVYSLITCKPCR